MNTFLISDTHFTHRNILTFLRADGQKLRPFETIEEMDETLIDNWNRVVRPTDKVIHLGDLVINKKALPILSRLNGKKKLIMGNHDDAHHSVLGQYFYDVKAYRVFDSCIMSHVPVHPNQLQRFSANVHGHLHSNYVLNGDGSRDNRYFNVSCDCSDMNFVPKPWEEIKSTLKERGVEMKFARSGKAVD